MNLGDTLRALAKLNETQAWSELRAAAERAATSFPESAEIAAYVAHALRQLGELEAGYTWAARGVAIDPENLFAINRVSLLANLTQRYAEAYAAADAVLEREPLTPGEAQNIAVTIVNSIHAASKLGLIAEAVERFSPAIERLDHDDLHFNSACLYTLAGDPRRLTYIYKALDAGKAKTAFADSDFDAIRDDPRFITLLARDWAAERYALQRAHTKTRAQLRPEDFVWPLGVGGEPNLERHEALERAIDANVDDVEGYLVYSDWLQGQSNPRGEFILASKRCDEARTEDERMLAYVDWAARLRANAGALLGEFALLVAGSTWHLGFICDLAFDVEGWRGKDASALLAATLALPVCRFVRTITVGDIPGEQRLNYGSVVEVLQIASLPHLRSLQIAPVDFEMSRTHLDISSLALPALESLVVGGGNLTLGELDFPKLRRLAVRTGGLTRENLEAVLAAPLPQLEDLEIWFGSQEYGATELSGYDITALCSRPVRRLALMNAEFSDQLIEPLVRSRILHTLEALDLSMGTLTDDGAREMIWFHAYYAHLTRISIDDNSVSDDVAADLRRALPQIHIGTQKGARYVSVGE